MRIIKHGNKEFDNQYYQRFLDDKGNVDLRTHLNWFDGWFRFINHYVKISQSAKSRVLELGCGVGVFCRVLYDKGFNVTGTEISDFALEKAKQANPGIHFQKLDIEKEISLAGKFDYIFAFEVMEHLPNPVKALDNIYKMIRPKGVFIFSTTFISNQALKDPTHINVHNPDWWIEKGKKARFKDLKYTYATSVPWLFRLHRIFSIIIPIKIDITNINSTCVYFFIK